MARPVVDVIIRAKDQSKRVLNGIRSRLAALGKSLLSVGGVLTGFLAFKVVQTLGKWVTAFTKQEDAVVTLNAALRATGRFSEEASEGIQKMASSLQAATRHGDEALLAATATVAQLAKALDPSQLAETQKILVGIADVFTKGDLQSAALLVGKAIAGNVSSLSRYGIVLEGVSGQQEIFAALLEKSGSFFEASKEAAGTTGGALVQLGNVIGDVQEVLGKLIVEIFGGAQSIQGLTRRITEFQGELEDSEHAVVGTARVIGAIFKALAQSVIAPLRVIFNFGQGVGHVLMGTTQAVAVAVATMLNLVAKGVNHVIKTVSFKLERSGLPAIKYRVEEIDTSALKEFSAANFAALKDVVSDSDDALNKLGGAWVGLGERILEVSRGASQDTAALVEMTRELADILQDVHSFKIEGGELAEAERLLAVINERLQEQNISLQERGRLLGARREVFAAAPTLAPPDPERLKGLQAEAKVLSDLKRLQGLHADDLERAAAIRAELAGFAQQELDAATRAQVLSVKATIDAVLPAGEAPALVTLDPKGLATEISQLKKAHELGQLRAADFERLFALQAQLNEMSREGLGLEERIQLALAERELAEFPIDLRPRVVDIPPVPPLETTISVPPVPPLDGMIHADVIPGDVPPLDGEIHATVIPGEVPPIDGEVRFGPSAPPELPELAVPSLPAPEMPTIEPFALFEVPEIELPVDALAQGPALLDQWAVGLAQLGSEGQRFGDVLVELTDTFADDFTGAIATSFEALVTGAANAGEAFKGAMLGAVAEVARGQAKLYIAEALGALGRGILGDPKGFAAAAQFFAAAAAFSAVAGLLGGAAAGGGAAGGGSATAQSFGRDVSGEAAPATTTIVIEGDYLSTKDPRQADALARAIEDNKSRNVIVRGSRV